jgi:hypothetical protein
MAVHKAASMKNWMAAKGIQVLEHPPYSLDLAPADFFLFRRVKEALKGITVDQDSLKNAWERVTRTITTKDFATALWHGLGRPNSAFGLVVTSSFLI